MRHGLSLVTLNVRKHNYAAIGIYSALGFREVGDPRRDREVLRMALRLDSAD
jgi:ribosomal protein S18 acetylase RimI-like enzyme